MAVALVVLSLVVYGAFALAGRAGFGPFAPPPDPTDPAALLPPPAPPPRADWLRPGALLGLPIAWMVVCLLLIPIGLYVASYIPWAFVEGHRITATWPPGHEGQTLIDLTRQMYDYHNNLTDGHAASSPWWAWPFDLKPVWFYQEGFAGSTTAAIYDAGNLVIWWLGVPALAFVAWQAYARRSLALALDRHRVRLPVDRVGPDRPARVPVPLLHEPAVRDPRPRLFRRGALARHLEADLAPGAGVGRGGRDGSGAALALRSPACAPSSASNAPFRTRRSARRSSRSSS